MVHSRDDQELSVAHEVKSSENQPPDDNGLHWLDKLNPNKLSDRLSKTFHRILKISYLTEFSID